MSKKRLAGGGRRLQASEGVLNVDCDQSPITNLENNFSKPINDNLNPEI